MAKKTAPKANPDSNTRKDPSQWKTGDEPMTGAQKSYLHTLAESAGEKVDDSLSKAEASEKIDELRGEATLSPAKSTDGNTQKDPEQWKTGDEPMTGAQKSYLQTLSEEAGEEFDEKLSKAEASERIDELRRRNPRTAK